MEKADYIFTRAIIDNEDFLQKAISLSDEIKETLFLSVGYSKGVYFMRFLRNNFTKKETIELFESINTNMEESNIVQNTVKVFKSLPLSLVYDKFKKTNNNFIELHNEFTRLQAMEEEWLKAYHESIRELGLSELPINNMGYIPNGII